MSQSSSFLISIANFFNLADETNFLFSRLSFSHTNDDFICVTICYFLTYYDTCGIYYFPYSPSLLRLPLSPTPTVVIIHTSIYQFDANPFLLFLFLLFLFFVFFLFFFSYAISLFAFFFTTFFAAFYTFAM